MRWGRRGTPCASTEGGEGGEGGDHDDDCGEKHSAWQRKGNSAPQRQHAPATTDARFARLHTDPRFLRPQRDDAKVAVDDRFKSLLGGAGAAGAGGDFGIHKRGAKVDRFGRKTKKGRSKEDEEIQRLYKTEGEGDEDDDEESEDDESDGEDEDESAAGPIDYARGAVELESSGEEDSSDEGDSDSDSSDASGDVAIGSAAVLRRERKRRAQRDESDSDSEGEDVSDDDDEEVDEAAEKEIDPRALAALDAQAERAVAEAAEAGPSTATSSSKAASSSSSKRSKRSKQATIAPGEETRRLAIVNMDWDHVRALDIYKVFSSLVSPHATRLPGAADAPTTGSTGRSGSSSQQVKGLVESVRVYPSDFGRERMKREDIEGPPRDIFRTTEDDAAAAQKKKKRKSKGKKRRNNDDSDDDEDDAVFEVDEGAEFDDEALRKYQLDRLRYYYAIATFDSAAAARHVYDVVDGAEMERTANIFDLQFVPDGMDFPDVPDDKDEDVEGFRDEAKPGLDDAATYRGADWATDALRHSKVKLTWDAPDPERMKVTRMRNMTKGEIRDDDFRAYLASDSEGDDDDDTEGAEEAQASMGKAGAAGRDRFRALLGLDDNAGGGKNAGVFGKSRSSAFEDARDDDGLDEDGDMEITFLPGLSEAAARKAVGGSAAKDADKEETTLEKYMRKQREKKERRRAARGEAAGGDEEEQETAPRPAAASETKDLGFDDPFFASGGEEEDGEDLDAILAKEKAREAKQKGNKNQSSISQAAIAPADVVGDGDESEDDGRHFSMQDVLKAESAKAGKKPNRWERKKLAKLAKRAAADGGRDDEATAALAQQKKKLEAQPDFKLDTADPRFFSANTLDDHRFAVDPTHPSYMKTEGMQRALEERRKRGGRKGPVEEEEAPQSSRGSSKQDNGKKRKQDKMMNGSGEGAAGGGGGDDTSELLASIKRREREQQGRKGLKPGKKQRTDK